AEIADLREDRDTLREDLASREATSATGPEAQAASSLRAALESRRLQDASGSTLEQRLLEADGSDEDLARRLKAELELSEKMLRGFEKENENLAQQNRQLRQGARLKREEVDGRQLQLVADLNNAKASADANPASMRRVAELERELVAVKERADEHGRELEKCREAKRALERELLTGPQQQQRGADLSVADAARLGASEAARSKAVADVAELQEKVRFFAESQQQMVEDRMEVARLAEELRASRGENAELRRRPGAKEASRRTAELRKQIEELQECLRKRHPDSILALVKACEPPPEQRRELRELQGKVEELEAQLAERDELYDRRVRALRAQYDHMRLEFERRAEGRVQAEAQDAGHSPSGALSAFPRDEARRAAPDREAVLMARIKDLERQVEHTKSYYLTKLRKREPLVPSPSKPSSKPGANGAGGGGNNPDSRQGQHVQHLQQQLRDRDARIDELSRTLEGARGSAGYAALAAESRMPSRHSSVMSEGVHCPGVSGLRLFLASPEGVVLAGLCAEQRALAHFARRRRFDEVAAQARLLLSVLSAQEAAAAAGRARADDFSGAEVGASPVGFLPLRGLGQQDDALRLGAHTPLPSSVWASWRRSAEVLASVAASASLQSGIREEELASQVAAALAEFRGCLESVLRRLLCLPAGGDEGVAAITASASMQPALESLLPRLLLEGAREQMDDTSVYGSRMTPTAVAVLQDAEAHAGLDHKLPWSELLAVLKRSGLGGDQLLQECRQAAHPDWTLSMPELRQLLGATPGAPSSQTSAAASSFVHALTRIRLAVASHGHPLLLAFRGLDKESEGFVARGDFLEALRSIPCALSLEERLQLAAYFSPAGDPRWVCYPLLLQSVVPERGREGRAVAAISASCDGARWAAPRAGSSSLTSPFDDGGVQQDAWAGGQRSFTENQRSLALQRQELVEAQAETQFLRERLRVQESRSSEQAALVAELAVQPPAQAVRRLQAEVAVLESRVLEQQTNLLAGARKAEITLRADLDVSRHEAATLRRALEARDAEVRRYQTELEMIISELAFLRGGADGEAG
ncbi:unnamed protein product, partial [Polarella glacialis]